MVDEGYNTHAKIRSSLNMGPTLPTNDSITDWVDQVDETIETIVPSPVLSAARTIEMGRLKAIYWSVKHGETKDAVTPFISPLTDDEISDLRAVGRRLVWAR